MHRRVALAGLLSLTWVVSYAADKPGVFVTDSQSWEIMGSAGGANGAYGAQTHGGARPQTAEIVKTFGERCPEVVINNIHEKADYVVVLDHEGGKGVIRKDNKVAVFGKDGDAIVSKSTRSLGNSVQDACNAIVADWAKRGATINAAQKEPSETATASPTPPITTQPATVKVTVDPGVSGAEIEVDGEFVGTTPSTIDLTPGEHDIKISKAGYKVWQRKMNVSGGSINVSPQLEK